MNERLEAKKAEFAERDRLIAARGCPRYVVCVPCSTQRPVWEQWQNLGPALERAKFVGGLVYEPLGMTTAEKVLAEPDTSRLLTGENELAEVHATVARAAQYADKALAELQCVSQCLARVKAAHRVDLEHVEDGLPSKYELFEQLTDRLKLKPSDILELLWAHCDYMQKKQPATLGGEPLRVASAWAHATASLAQMAEQCREERI